MRWRRKRQVPEIRFLALNPSSAEPREFRILKSEISIGSAEDNQFVIRRPGVSRRHATLAYRRDHYELFDPGSTNGTFVNGSRVTTPVMVELGDEVRFGDALFALGKPLGLPASSSTTPKKSLRRRGLLEALVLAFAVGFGVAQYLAYLLYHEQNRLILAEAVPVPVTHTANAAAPTPVSNQHIARSTPAETVFHARRPTTPVAIAHAVAPKIPKLSAIAPEFPKLSAVAPKVLEIPKLNPTAVVGDKELGGGIALARLIASSGTAAGQPAPGLSLPNLDGTEVSLEAMRGKIVLLNFWATWCGACRSEMPSLENLYRDFRSYQDFAALAVSIDRRGNRAVAQFMANNGYNFPVLLDGENVASGAYGVSGIPSTFVIGRHGRIIWNCVGALDWSNPSLRDALKKLL
ncbi:MAG TPA: redoxin domain-containing protein [Candidatus Binataceae bacterium]|nr:redoxin domain-containing protein [Candidatus Binataceae bacterium]